MFHKKLITFVNVIGWTRNCIYEGFDGFSVIDFKCGIRQVFLEVTEFDATLKFFSYLNKKAAYWKFLNIEKKKSNIKNAIWLNSENSNFYLKIQSLSSNHAMCM